MIPEEGRDGAGAGVVAGAGAGAPVPDHAAGHVVVAVALAPSLGTDANLDPVPASRAASPSPPAATRNLVLVQDPVEFDSTGAGDLIAAGEWS